MPGGGELIVIALVILLLFGGKELPKVARTLGKWTSIFRRSMNDIRREINRIAMEDELKEAKKKFSEFDSELKSELNLDKYGTRKLYDDSKTSTDFESKKPPEDPPGSPYKAESETSGMETDPNPRDAKSTSDDSKPETTKSVKAESQPDEDTPPSDETPPDKAK